MVQTTTFVELGARQVITKESVYKLCAIWGISLIALLLIMPLAAMYLANNFWLYAEGVLLLAGLGGAGFGILSHRPDIREDLNSEL